MMRPVRAQTQAKALRRSLLRKSDGILAHGLRLHQPSLRNPKGNVAPSRATQLRAFQSLMASAHGPRPPIQTVKPGDVVVSDFRPMGAHLTP